MSRALGPTTRAEIDGAVLDWIREDDWSRRDDDRFEALALALFRLQYAACEPYARLCRTRDATPESVDTLTQIPTVPTGAFKEFPLRGFPPEATIRTFRTSGTATQTRGALHLDTLALYEASLLASLRRCLLTDLVARRVPMRFLAASGDEAPDSSLSHMFACLREAEGGDGSGFDLRDGRLDVNALGHAVEEARLADAPIVVAGTSFAFVHLLDALGESAFGGSVRTRIVETPRRLTRHGDRRLQGAQPRRGAGRAAPGHRESL